MASSSGWPIDKLVEASTGTLVAAAAWFLYPNLPELPAVMSYSSTEVTESVRPFTGFIVNICVVASLFQWYGFFVRFRQYYRARPPRVGKT